MKIDQNPFSLYDFLGYLVPGLLFFTGINLIIMINKAQPKCLNINALKIEEFLFVIFGCYFIGHILSYISSITIENYSRWTIGYPSRYLLKHERNKFWIRRDAGAFQYINVLNFLKILISLFLFPITVFDLFIRQILKLENYLKKPLDNLLVELIKKSVLQYVLSNYDLSKVPTKKTNEERDFFRIIYHYTLENAPNHRSKMQNYVALYGFTRTMSLSIVLLFWVELFFLIKLGFSFRNSVLFGSSFMLSYVLYLDFNKFYRKYTLESLMAMLIQYKYQLVKKSNDA